jgi:hypothetical protein
MSRGDDSQTCSGARNDLRGGEQEEKAPGVECSTPGTPQALARRLIVHPVALLIASFAISRVAFYLAGVRLVVQGQYQDVDFHLLRTDLISSIWHLNMQPPLYNTFLGLVLKLPLGIEESTIVVCWVIAGLVLVMSTYLLLRELHVPRWVAFGVTLVGVVLSPSYVFAENWMYLAYPTAAFLALTGLLLARAIRTGRPWYVAGFSASASAVVLLNSTYQWIWLLPVCILALFGLRHHGWRKLLIPLVVPLLVVGLWYVKNAVMFGTDTTSSWLGMNLAKLTFKGTDVHNIKQLVHQGRLSPLALIVPFSAPAKYIPRFVHITPRSGIPVLDELYKREAEPPFGDQSLQSADEKAHDYPPLTNYNNPIYTTLATKYLRDDLVFIEDRPLLYLQETRLSVETWFVPSDQYSFFAPNMPKIHTYERLYDVLAEWQPRPAPYYGPALGVLIFHTGPSLLTLSYQAVLATSVTFLGAPLLVRRRRGRPAMTTARTTLLFIWFTVSYSTVATSLIELGENNRFRLELGPLPLIGATAVVVAGLQTLRTRHQGSPS